MRMLPFLAGKPHRVSACPGSFPHILSSIIPKLSFYCDFDKWVKQFICLVSFVYQELCSELAQVSWRRASIYAMGWCCCYPVDYEGSSQRVRGLSFLRFPVQYQPRREGLNYAPPLWRNVKGCRIRGKLILSLPQYSITRYESRIVTIMVTRCFLFRQSLCRRLFISLVRPFPLYLGLANPLRYRSKTDSKYLEKYNLLSFSKRYI